MDKNKPQDWYFTFGQAHEYNGCYIVFENAAFQAARDMMFARFGQKWAFQYSEEEWNKGSINKAEQYGYRRIY